MLIRETKLFANRIRKVKLFSVIDWFKCSLKTNVFYTLENKRQPLSVCLSVCRWPVSPLSTWDRRTRTHFTHLTVCLSLTAGTWGVCVPQGYEMLKAFQHQHLPAVAGYKSFTFNCSGWERIWSERERL